MKFAYLNGKFKPFAKDRTWESWTRVGLGKSSSLTFPLWCSRAVVSISVCTERLLSVNTAEALWVSSGWIKRSSLKTQWTLKLHFLSLKNNNDNYLSLHNVLKAKNSYVPIWLAHVRLGPMVVGAAQQCWTVWAKQSPVRYIPGSLMHFILFERKHIHIREGDFTAM